MLQGITSKPNLERTTVDYLDLTKVLAELKARVERVEKLWHTRETKTVYEIDPENEDSKKNKATH